MKQSGFTTTLNLTLTATPSEAQERKQLARFGRWLYRLGFVPGTAGNLSVRLHDGTILATPTGMSKSLVKPADMVIVDLDGNQLAGTRCVTSEIGMHLAAYRRRSDVRAVVHAHPPIATGFASCGMGLTEPLCSEVVMCLGSIPLAPYATTGTDAVGESIEPLVLEHDAVLLANHGAVTLGSSLLEAFMRMETVEHFAHISLVAHQLGCPKPLNGNNLAQLADARSRYHRNALSGPARADA